MMRLVLCLVLAARAFASDGGDDGSKGSHASTGGDYPVRDRSGDYEAIFEDPHTCQDCGELFCEACDTTPVPAGNPAPSGDEEFARKLEAEELKGGSGNPAPSGDEEFARKLEAEELKGGSSVDDEAADKTETGAPAQAPVGEALETPPIVSWGDLECVEGPEVTLCGDRVGCHPSKRAEFGGESRALAEFLASIGQCMHGPTGPAPFKDDAERETWKKDVCGGIKPFLKADAIALAKKAGSTVGEAGYDERGRGKRWVESIETKYGPPEIPHECSKCRKVFTVADGLEGLVVAHTSCPATKGGKWNGRCVNSLGAVETVNGKRQFVMNPRPRCPGGCGISRHDRRRPAPRQDNSRPNLDYFTDRPLPESDARGGGGFFDRPGGAPPPPPPMA